MEMNISAEQRDVDALLKGIIKSFMNKSVGPSDKKQSVDLENMPDSDRKALNSRHAIYQEIIQQFPLLLGKELSKKERANQNFESTSFTYGEIEFKSFAEIFYLIKKKYNQFLPAKGRFYDLGSGIGKGVIAATVLNDFESCTGIEYLQSLHDTALKLKESYDIYTNSKKISDGLEKEITSDWTGQTFQEAPRVNFECGDILKKYWLDGTLVFANSTCFDPHLMWDISKIAKMLPKDTLFITTTKRLPDYFNWDVLECYKTTMSWGDATVYIHKKRNNPSEEDKIAFENMKNENHEPLKETSIL
jgi:hypothetical protein